MLIPGGSFPADRPAPAQLPPGQFQARLLAQGQLDAEPGPVPRASLVADVKTDMFMPLFPLKTLMVLGLDESDLGQDVIATAKALSPATEKIAVVLQKAAVRTCARKSAPPASSGHAIGVARPSGDSTPRSLCRKLAEA